MKNFLFASALLLAQGVLGMGADTITVSSDITSVTVFFNGAQVSRTTALNVPAGKHLLLFDQLPFEINPQSIQVEGVDACEILSVKHMLAYNNPANKDADEKLVQDKIDKMEFNIRDLSNQLTVYDMELKLLKDNSDLSKKGEGTAIGDIKEAADFYRLRLNEILQSKLKIGLEMKSAGDSLQKLYAHKNELLTRVRQVYSQILILVDCKKAINQKFVISYYIASAGWTPVYDFRVDDITHPFSIVYNANVYQSSGEDWKNVNVKLSTNNPSLTGDKPELAKWIITQGDPNRKVMTSGGTGSISGRITDQTSGEPIPFVNVMVKKDGALVSGAITDWNGQYLIKPLQEGYWTLEFSYVGYETKALDNVYVRLNYENIQDIVMSTNIQEIQMVALKCESSVVTIVEDAYDMDLIPTLGMDNSEIVNGSFRGGIYKKAKEDYRSDGWNYNEQQVSDYRQQQNLVDLVSGSLKMNLSNLEYDIEIPYSLPSDGQDYLINIRDTNLMVNYIYQTVPKLDQDAFLTAEIIDWSGLNLLSGKTSIYYHGTFTGESYIDANNTSDTLSISLGRDKNILVTREGNKKIFDKRVIGSSIKETIGYDITVKNNKLAPIRIVIEDQIPLSDRKSVEVLVLDNSGAKYDEKTGMMTWEYTLQAGEKKVLLNQYSVKYPKDLYLDY